MNWKTFVLMAIPAVLLTATPRGSASEAVLATEALSPSTRALLIQEMQALAAAMGSIHRAMVTGEHQAVAAESQSIHDSFVLAQELSESQRQEIGTKLPPEFVSADQDFHALSARLVEAAIGRDARLERVWFDEMTRACLGCHRQFASKRFGGLTHSEAGPQHGTDTGGP